jgi:hypothetical protein
MKYEATVSFVGEICMMKGEERELDGSLAKPLVTCGYLKPVRKAVKNESKRIESGDDSEPHKRRSGKS